MPPTIESLSSFCAISSETVLSCDDPTVVFSSDSSTYGVGDFTSGSQNARMSSSISINDSELSSWKETQSDAVDSSSSSP